MTHFLVGALGAPARFLTARKSAIGAAVLAASALLAACGGGGGGGADAASGAMKSAAAPASASAATTAQPTQPTQDASDASPPANTTTASSDGASKPVGTGLPASSLFYGVNGHNNEGGAYDISSTALQLAQLQDLGMKLYRNEVYSQASATKLARIAATMALGGVTVYPVLLVDASSFANETDAYNAAYALGQQTATSYPYPYYEVSNELASGALTGNVDGVYPQQFVNAKFQLARGAIRGLIDGIKSVDTNGKIVMGGDTRLHYGFDQMLFDGTQPDGTSGHPRLTWDITAWHWYSEQGDITHACGGTGCHDVLGALQAFGKPIWLTEFGVRPWLGNDQQIAAYMVGDSMMAQFVSVASRYNLQSIQAYELYDDPIGGEGNYGLLMNDGVTQKPAYGAVKSFIAAHPM
ncbi:glycosyl hydrolase [Caballeronia sp. Lep1P3]|uniref:glycosyl hydrolase n=1 Tax=Caballeronia sp. Lep1P3 TaxID=2878150 RepID=UPI001FD0D3C8|nr:glycosyl hydrolase [Caballeronia sp. Lep1P3]